MRINDSSVLLNSRLFDSIARVSQFHTGYGYEGVEYILVKPINAHI